MNNDEENQEDQVDGMDNMKKKVQDFSRQLKSQMKFSRDFSKCDCIKNPV